MIYLIIVLSVIALLAILLWRYLKRNILLPKEVDQWIAEIKAKPEHNWHPGKLGFFRRKEVFICYEVIGEPTGKGDVLLISGHGQTMLGFPKFFYEPLLEAGYRIIRMDNRSVGASSWMLNWSRENAYTLEDMAGDALGLIDHLGIEKVHLIGVSMGGMIAQHMSINKPERIKTLSLLMTTAFFWDPEMGGIPKKIYRDFVLIALVYGRQPTTLEGKLKLHLAVYRLLKGKGNYERDHMAILEKAYYHHTRRTSTNIYARDQQAYAIKKSGSRLEELKAITMPTLVVHGDDDPLVPFGHGKKLAALLPNAKKLFIDGMGHDLPRAHTPAMLEAIFELMEVEKSVEV